MEKTETNTQPEIEKEAVTEVPADVLASPPTTEETAPAEGASDTKSTDEASENAKPTVQAVDATKKLKSKGNAPVGAIIIGMVLFAGLCTLAYLAYTKQ